MLSHLNPDRKALSDFLVRKGFSFAEDVDLAQLDRQHRKLTDLDEVPIVKPKKKRRPDLLRILDGEDLSDVVDDLDGGNLSTAARRQNYEQAMLAKASWAQETAAWDQQFKLRRSDLDETQNQQFKESFIRHTKSVYSDIDRKIRRKQQVCHQKDFAKITSCTDFFRAEHGSCRGFRRLLELGASREQEASAAGQELELQRDMPRSSSERNQVPVISQRFPSPRAVPHGPHQH